MNLSLLPAAHQLLLPLFHRTNESIGLEKLVGRDKDVSSVGRGQTRLGFDSLPVSQWGSEKGRRKSAPTLLPRLSFLPSVLASIASPRGTG